ncbi:MAG: hypothetical protein SVV80_07650 [Planctomycetota bacterium]|nr:hypothetical protein [Planctomycetota bacterium]
MNRRTVLIILLSGFMVFTGGCISRIAKEGLGGVTGGKGSFAVLQPVSATLGVYERFELTQLADDMNGMAPSELFSALPGEFAKALDEEKIPNASSGRTLLIQGKILHYENASMSGHAFGPLEEVVARIELVDKDAGKVIGVANCVGRTKESVNTGVSKKTEGLARAIVKWIKEHYPEDQRTK